MLKQTSAEKIRSVCMCAAVSLALLCACMQMCLAQDAAGTASSKSPAASKSKTTAQSRTAAKSHYRKSKRSSARRRTARGQQKIDPERAQEIQQALVREHYLSSKDEGSWNQASEDAMRRYQADHGWQSKTVPDSRALISLGLGPSHDHLLNPESAMTSDPAPAHETQSATTSARAQGSASSASAAPAAKSQPVARPVSEPAATDPPGPQ
jgi:hypothetical protein